MDAIQLHRIPGPGIPVPSGHCAYIGWGSDGGSDEGIHVCSLLCDVGNVGTPVTSNANPPPPLSGVGTVPKTMGQSLLNKYFGQAADIL